MSVVIGAFAVLLKEWRALRHMSQLALSLEAGLSQRHLSFLETGRARPSRDAVLRLAESLAMPLRERNALLHAAGFAPAFAGDGLSAARAETFAHAVNLTLEHHAPYPALVLDGHWNVVGSNAGASRLFGAFVDVDTLTAKLAAYSDFQVIRACLAHGALSPFLVDREHLLASFASRLRRRRVLEPTNTRLHDVLGSIEAERAGVATPADGAAADPVTVLRLAHGALRLELFTMLVHFNHAHDVLLDELAVELFFPADDATRAFFVAG